MSHQIHPVPETILIVEDDAGLAELIATVVRDQGAEAAHVATGAEALTWLADRTPALVLLDYALPDMTGLQFLEWSSRPLPFIVTTGAGDERTAVTMMRHGARDYVIKDTRFLENLPLAIRRVLDELGTARRLAQAEAALLASEARHRSILQTAMDGFWLVDTHGRILEVNETYCRISGYSVHELQHMRISDLEAVETADDIAARIQKITTQGEDRFESRHRRKDGSIVDVEISVQHRPDEGGRVVAFIRDITERKLVEQERKQLQAQLIQAQKLEAIGTLAGGVAHEINNPIMGIMGYAQLILDTLAPDAPASQYAAEISRETERVATIVRNLLAFARQEKQSHSAARMCDVVASTLSLIRAVMRHDQVTLVIDIPEDLPRIGCRSQQIQQVVMNLLTNARDALNEKYPGYHANKTVLITARVIENNGRQWVRTTVEDHGPGIPAPLLERIFDPFFTTKPRDKGTGLGLSISHGIVKDHGGELSVESTEGESTRFHLDLPVA